MSRYSFEIRALVERILPPTKRQQAMWLVSLLEPLESLIEETNEYATDSLYFNSFTGQKASMEALLNDLFDNLYRRIYIENNRLYNSRSAIHNKSETADHLVIYNKSENENNAVIYNKSEVNPNNSDYYHFIVYLPNSITLDLNYLKSVINRVKLAGKSYKVFYFSA